MPTLQWECHFCNKSTSFQNNLNVKCSTGTQRSSTKRDAPSNFQIPSCNFPFSILQFSFLNIHPFYTSKFPHYHFSFSTLQFLFSKIHLHQTFKLHTTICYLPYHNLHFQKSYSLKLSNSPPHFSIPRITIFIFKNPLL